MQTRRVTYSAPGKLMLFGEHAVVYDRPCIVSAAGRRLETSVQKRIDDNFVLRASGLANAYEKDVAALGVGDIPTAACYVEQAVAVFFKTYPALRSGISIETKAGFASTLGFGSSAAITVATMAALADIFEQVLSKKALFDLAYQTILQVAGRGSGFDVVAAVYGGTILYQDAGRIIEPLASSPLPLIVGYTGKKVDTRTIIDQVAELKKYKTEKLEQIFDGMERIVQQGLVALDEHDLPQVGQLMNSNQSLLEEIEVSSPILDQLIQAARQAGAYGAKLSGAGIGDCMIAVAAEDKRQKVIDAIEAVGGEWIDVEMGVGGVRQELR